MAIEVDTLDPKEIKSNQVTLCGDLIDLDTNDYVLAYFRYSKDQNLDVDYKSKQCALLSSPASYELIQDNIDDNSSYYFKAAAENFESTETQIEHLKNLRILSTNSSDIFNNENIVSSLLDNAETFASLFNNEDNMYNIWKSDNLDMIFDVSKEVSGDIRETSFKDGSIYIHTHDHASQELIFKPKIDFSNINSLKLDVEKSGDSGGEPMNVLIDDEKVFNEDDTFARKTITIDASNIESTSSLKLTFGASLYDSNKTEIFGIWGE